MTGWIAEAGERMGGIKRVVLGHGHPDHRGGAPGLGVPVLCHPAERSTTRGSSGGPPGSPSPASWPAGTAGPCASRARCPRVTRYAGSG
jgi:glyoxylase-like metal-dependent hydrolase (beta-lactamase superfamily II)